VLIGMPYERQHESAMNIVLKTEYWNDLNARAAFKSFMRTIHGLDFSLWESAGCWDDAYTPFSFFRGDKIVASVCIYLLDSVIDGRETRLAQVSGVGTLPQWRRDWRGRKTDTTAFFSSQTPMRSRTTSAPDSIRSRNTS
jgi:hypothetical protein